MLFRSAMCSVVSNSCNPMDCSPPGSSVHGILYPLYMGLYFGFYRGSHIEGAQRCTSEWSELLVTRHCGLLKQQLGSSSVSQAIDQLLRLASLCLEHPQRGANRGSQETGGPAPPRLSSRDTGPWAVLAKDSALLSSRDAGLLEPPERPQGCPTLCNPMNHSTPGLPVHHKLPEFTQTHTLEEMELEMTLKQ